MPCGPVDLHEKRDKVTAALHQETQVDCEHVLPGLYYNAVYIHVGLIIQISRRGYIRGICILIPWHLLSRTSQC